MCCKFFIKSILPQIIAEDFHIRSVMEDNKYTITEIPHLFNGRNEVSNSLGSWDLLRAGDVWWNFKTRGGTTGGGGEDKGGSPRGAQ